GARGHLRRSQAPTASANRPYARPWGWARTAGATRALGERVSRLVGDRIPLREAPPVVFTRRANLVREAEAIGPAFLLPSPAAVPDELVHVRVARRMNLHSAHEVRASRLSAERHPLDRKVRLGRKDVGEQPTNLDLRGRTLHADVFGATGLAKVANRILEMLR